MKPPMTPPSADRCPFINDDAPACASRFTLGHLDEAFDLCLDRYQACPTYYRLLNENPGKQLILLTTHGQPLLPTGT